MRNQPLISKHLRPLLCSALLATTTLLSLPGYAFEIPPAPNLGTISRTLGGGRRSGCASKDINLLTALVPANNINVLTGEPARLFVYVPKSKVKTAELNITDDQKKLVYQTKVALLDKAGILRLDIPKTVKLNSNKFYRWEFSIICNPNDPNTDLVIGGHFYPIKPDAKLETALKQAPASKQVELYQNAKIWQNALNTAARLRTSSPSQWERLLKSEKLDRFVREPFVN